jgi:hypothetical protein
MDKRYGDGVQTPVAIRSSRRGTYFAGITLSFEKDRAVSVRQKQPSFFDGEVEIHTEAVMRTLLEFATRQGIFSHQPVSADRCFFGGSQ